MKILTEQAAALLNAGKVVGVPTETVYGLAAALSCPQAIANIFSLKGRPANNPLIIHVLDPIHIHEFAKEIPPYFHELAAAFWPGPMTLVLPVHLHTISHEVRAGLPTAAFRIPQHTLTRQLLALTGPLVMPSANLSGRPSATTADHVEQDFGKQFPVLDGGACQQGMESTVLHFHEGKWVIIRQGALTASALATILPYTPCIAGKPDKEQPLCPGQLYRHYAPKASLRLEGLPPQTGAIIGFSDRQYPPGCHVLTLSASTDPKTAANRLYAILRQLDEEGIETAWVDMQFSQEDLWLTIKERLHKAASP